MRVVHVAPTYLGRDSLIGGGERYATELAKAMAQQVPTRLISFGEKTRREQWGNLEAHIYKPLWHAGGISWNPVSLSFLRSLEDADVIHCHQFLVLSTSLSVLFGHLRRRSVFVTDLGGGAGSLSRVLGIGQKVSAFLHISSYSAQQKPFRFFRNEVISGGVATRFFQPASGSHGQRVLFVGRIRPAKGVHLLIEALPPSIPLDVVGPVLDQEYFQRLQQLAQGKQVTFHTPCSDAELADYYARATATVLPSLPGTELLGLVLLESMACATPVICTRVGGMPEVVVEGVTGFVVPPNDVAALREKLVHLLAHPDLAEKMGRLGREKMLERFTWDAVVQRCLQAYQDKHP